MNKTQKGFTLIEGLLIILILAIIGFGGYYVWHTQQQTNKTLDTAASTSQKAAATASNNDLSQKYLTIKEWGVRAPYSGKLNIEYKIMGESNSLPGEASFSSSELDSSGSGCKVDLSQEGGYGGVIDQWRSSDEYTRTGVDSGMTAAEFAATLDKSTYGHVGNHYYFYEHPQALCGEGQNSEDLQTQTQDAVMSIVANLQATPQ